MWNRDNKDGGDRDVFNEKPTREEQTIASAQPVKSAISLGTTAVLHTTMGDIHLRLFPEHAPKTVENFVGHAKSGYFEGVIFHRVIKKFVSTSLALGKVGLCCLASGLMWCLLFADASNWRSIGRRNWRNVHLGPGVRG